MELINSGGGGALQMLCKANHRYGAYFSIFHDPSDDLEEIVKSAPFLVSTQNEDAQAIMDEEGYILFDSEDEMELYYSMTVGDDGPTDINYYDGPTKTYMITCSPEGKLLNENT